MARKGSENIRIALSDLAVGHEVVDRFGYSMGIVRSVRHHADGMVTYKVRHHDLVIHIARWHSRGVNKGTVLVRSRKAICGRQAA